MRLLISICAFGLLTATSVVAAPPKLNSIFPTGVQRGQTQEIVANGSWDVWPVSAWMNRPGLQVACDADKGKLKVTADANAEPGWVWMRLTNKEGATAAKPIYIGTLPEATEKEPNDEFSSPQKLEQSSFISGRLSKRGDVDTFALKVSKGQTLVAAVQANSVLNSPVDTVLQICSSDGFVLAHNDDAAGMDPLLTYQAPADATYLVRVFGFPATPDSTIGFAGSDAFIYRLTMTTGGYVDHAIPMAVSQNIATEVRLRGWNLPPGEAPLSLPPTDSTSVLAFQPTAAGSVALTVVEHATVVEADEAEGNPPQSVALPSTITGTIQKPGDEDVFSFTAKKGQSLSFDVESDELGFLLDGTLAITDSTGKSLADADDSRRARDPQVNFTVPADGEYRVTVRDAHGHGGDRFVYRLTATETKRGFNLKVSPDTYVVKAGASVEITVNVDRDRGFDQEIEIAASGLPAGVTVAAIKSSKDGPTAKSVKLVVQAAADAQSGAFEIMGKAADQAKPQRARLEGDGVSPSVSQLFLTVTPAG